jgi:1,4-dihydroxy-6-naphthoate synthase
MNITLGFSPCPNDTYMFAALVNQWIDTGGLNFVVHMEDIEKLNELAGSSFLDVTKLSFNRALSLQSEYSLLSSGAALGQGCGPILIAKKNLTPEEIRNGPVALPGQWTTANLLFDIFYPDCRNKEFHLFSDIENLILTEAVAAGVIIHENRFTYEGKGLLKLNDLGESWEMLTNSPIPLGGIFSSSRISDELKGKIEELIRKSILFAHHQPEVVMPYVRQYSQEMDPQVMLSHIALYVNDFSLDLGEVGRQSIETLKKFTSR